MNDRNVATPTGKPWSAMTVIGARDLQPHRLRARRARQWKLPSPGNHGVHQPLLNRVHRTILYFFAPFRGGSGLPELSARRIVISANMTGAPLSAACINIAAANRHSGWSCFTFGSAAMNSPAVAQRSEHAAIRHHHRVVERAGPAPIALHHGNSPGWMRQPRHHEACSRQGESKHLSEERKSRSVAGLTRSGTPPTGSDAGSRFFTLVQCFDRPA